MNKVINNKETNGWLDTHLTEKEVLTAFSYDAQDSTIRITTETKSNNALIINPNIRIKEYTYGIDNGKMVLQEEKSGNLVTIPQQTNIVWDNQ